MHPHRTLLDQVVATVEQARVEATEPLRSALPHIFVGVDSRFKQIISYLSGVGGLAVGVTQTTSAFPTMADLAEATGTPLRNEAVAPVDTTPTDDEKEFFRNAVHSFAETIPTASDDTVLSVLNVPMGDKILRSVAKLAGLEDFRDASLDILFVSRIREALVKAANVLAEQEAFKANEAITPALATPADAVVAPAEANTTDQTTENNGATDSSPAVVSESAESVISDLTATEQTGEAATTAETKSAKSTAKK